MKLDVESLLNTRWVGAIHAILSFGIAWVYPEDYGNTVSASGIALTTGSELSTFGDVMGFLFAGAIITAAAFYLLHRWYGHVAGKISVTMLAMVVPHSIRSAGPIENIRLGYIAAAVPDGSAGEGAGGANCGNGMVLAHRLGMSGGAVFWW